MRCNYPGTHTNTRKSISAQYTLMKMRTKKGEGGQLRIERTIIKVRSLCDRWKAIYCSATGDAARDDAAVGCVRVEQGWSSQQKEQRHEKTRSAHRLLYYL